MSEPSGDTPSTDADPALSTATAAAFGMLDGAGDIIRVWAGVKAQFVAAGFTEATAEEMSVLLWRQSLMAFQHQINTGTVPQ